MANQFSIVEVASIPALAEIQPVDLSRPIEAVKVALSLMTVCEEQSGIGISAVQVGLPLQLFLVKGDGKCPLVPLNEYRCFVNCSYDPVGNLPVVTMEGCLSLKRPNGKVRTYLLERQADVRVRGHVLNMEGVARFEEIDVVLNLNEQGGVFQHEIDHHFGKLISDFGKEVFVW